MYPAKYLKLINTSESVGEIDVILNQIRKDDHLPESALFALEEYCYLKRSDLE